MVSRLSTRMPYPKYPNNIFPYKISYPHPMKLKSPVGAVICQFIFIEGMSFGIRNQILYSFEYFDPNFFRV